MKKISRGRQLVEHFKTGLKKVIPESENIDIHLTSEAPNLVKAQIELKTRSMYLVAQKTDRNLMRSLHKAQSAIIKQFKKHRVQKTFRKMKMPEFNS